MGSERRRILTWVLTVLALGALALGSLHLSVVWAEEEGAREWALLFFWPFYMLVVWSLGHAALHVAAGPRTFAPLSLLAFGALVGACIMDFVGTPTAVAIGLIVGLNYGAVLFAWQVALRPRSGNSSEGEPIEP